jgi:hypothetical protein
MPVSFRSIKTSFAESDLLKTIATVAVTLALGIGVAGATISSVPRDAVNPALRPLTIGGAVHVVRAFGPDDEDCVYETRRVTDPSGKQRNLRKLVCADD